MGRAFSSSLSSNKVSGCFSLSLRSLSSGSKVDLIYSLILWFSLMMFSISSFTFSCLCLRVSLMCCSFISFVIAASLIKVCLANGRGVYNDEDLVALLGYPDAITLTISPNVLSKA